MLKCTLSEHLRLFMVSMSLFNKMLDKTYDFNDKAIFHYYSLTGDNINTQDLKELKQFLHSNAISFKDSGIEQTGIMEWDGYLYFEISKEQLNKKIEQASSSLLSPELSGNNNTVENISASLSSHEVKKEEYLNILEGQPFQLKARPIESSTLDLKKLQTEREIKSYIKKSLTLCKEYIARMEKSPSEIADKKKKMVKEALDILEDSSKKDLEKLFDCADKLTELLNKKKEFDQNRDSWLLKTAKNISTLYIGLYLFRWIKYCLGYAGNTHGYNMISDMLKKAEELKTKHHQLSKISTQNKPNEARELELNNLTDPISISENIQNKIEESELNKFIDLIKTTENIQDEVEESELNKLINPIKTTENIQDEVEESELSKLIDPIKTSANIQDEVEESELSKLIDPIKTSKNIQDEVEESELNKLAGSINPNKQVSFFQTNTREIISEFNKKCVTLINLLNLDANDIKSIPLEVIQLINKNTALSYHPASSNDHDKWRYTQLCSYIPKEKQLSEEEFNKLNGYEELSGA